MMLPETLVLNSDGCVLGILSHFVIIDPFAVFSAMHGFILDHILAAVIGKNGSGIVKLQLSEIYVAYAFIEKSQNVDHSSSAYYACSNYHDKQKRSERLGDVTAGAQEQLYPCGSVSLLRASAL